MKHWLMSERERCLLREMRALERDLERDHVGECAAERIAEIEAELDALALALDAREES